MRVETALEMCVLKLYLKFICDTLNFVGHLKSRILKFCRRYSGLPMGLFPSHPDAPRMIVTNGMTIPNYSSMSDYEKYYYLGVSQYGQMTAGSYCYIGPQGIVHGTTITVCEAGRKYLGLHDLRGKVFVTAGLGGMSGAQPKAAVVFDSFFFSFFKFVSYIFRKFSSLKCLC